MLILRPALQHSSINPFTCYAFILQSPIGRSKLNKTLTINHVFRLLDETRSTLCKPTQTKEQPHSTTQKKTKKRPTSISNPGDSCCALIVGTKPLEGQFYGSQSTVVTPERCSHNKKLFVTAAYCSYLHKALTAKPNHVNMLNLQTKRPPCPADIWQQYQSVCCCCQWSKPE